MSNKDDNAAAAGDEESQTPVAGERLALARREQKIPILDVAKELHLDEHKVRAIESNQFDVIGAPVFAKGHLRKYAQLLKVDNAEIMSDYYELTRAEASAPALSVRPKPRRSISPGPWLILIAVLGAIGTAYWWFLVRENAPQVGVDSGTVSALPVEQGVLVEQPSDEALSGEESIAEESSVQLLAESNTLEQSAASPPLGVAEAELADGQLRMSIEYAGDSWTEISDANGRRLFFDLGKAGRTVNLTGEAPFNVLFGDAANVGVTVNGTSYELPPADRRGTVRVTIVAP